MYLYIKNIKAEINTIWPLLVAS